MSTDDDDEPLTDVNLDIDASALDAAAVARENVRTIPAGPLPADDEANTLKPMLAVVESAPTAATSGGATDDEEESTTLSLESRLLKAFQDAHKSTSDAKEVESPDERAVAAWDATCSALADDHEAVAPPEELEQETMPRTVPAPVLPKSERSFVMELIIPTVPAEFVVVDPSAPRGPKGTVKIVSSADGRPVITPVAATADVDLAVAAVSSRTTAQGLVTVVNRAHRRTRWGRWFALALLAALLAVGFVNRTAVIALARQTAR